MVYLPDDDSDERPAGRNLYAGVPLTAPRKSNISDEVVLQFDVLLLIKGLRLCLTQVVSSSMHSPRMLLH